MFESNVPLPWLSLTADLPRQPVCISVLVPESFMRQFRARRSVDWVVTTAAH